MLDELGTLKLIAEMGSLHAAARERGLSQSAITRQMQRLEDNLQVELLDRNVKPVRLTRAGEAVLARGRDILVAVGKLRDSVSPKAAAAGTLQLGLAHGLAEPSIAQPVQRFRARMPDVFPNLQSGLSARLQERIARGELDAALVLQDQSRPVPDRLESCRVGVEHRVIVRANGTDANLSDGRARWILNPEGCLFRAQLGDWLETNLGKSLLVAAEAHDTGLQLSLVASGVGLGLISCRVLERHPLARGVEVMRSPRLRLTADIRLVRAPGLGSMSKAIDLLQEQLEDLYQG